MKEIEFELKFHDATLKIYHTGSLLERRIIGEYIDPKSGTMKWIPYREPDSDGWDVHRYDSIVREFLADQCVQDDKIDEYAHVFAFVSNTIPIPISCTSDHYCLMCKEKGWNFTKAE